MKAPSTLFDEALILCLFRNPYTQPAILFSYYMRIFGQRRLSLLFPIVFLRTKSFASRSRKKAPRCLRFQRTTTYRTFTRYYTGLVYALSLLFRFIGRQERKMSGARLNLRVMPKCLRRKRAHWIISSIQN